MSTRSPVHRVVLLALLLLRPDPESGSRGADGGHLRDDLLSARNHPAEGDRRTPGDRDPLFSRSLRRPRPIQIQAHPAASTASAAEAQATRRNAVTNESATARRT